MRSQGQCQPADTKPSQSVSSESPQFYDEPTFTVAGVADTTNLGGHGSDTVVRTKESLAKDTVALSKQTAGNSSETSAGAIEKASSAGTYEESRTRILALLTKHDTAELHHQLGDVEEKLNHPLEAVREYQRAAELDPSEPNLFDWGTELLAHRAPEPAIEVFAKGNRLFPRSVRMLVGLAVAWHARGSYERAAECLGEASDLNPNDPTPYLFLGKMQNAGTIESGASVEKLARFARLHPENALANYYYAAALWKRSKGVSDAAIATEVQSLLRSAARLDPKLGLAYLQLGIVYSDLEQFPKAVAAYTQAIAASPELEESHYRLAQVYRRIGEKAKAQEQFQLYEQLSKKATQEAERQRHEIQQFVVALRDVKPSGQAEKP